MPQSPQKFRLGFSGWFYLFVIFCGALSIVTGAAGCRESNVVVPATVLSSEDARELGMAPGTYIPARTVEHDPSAHERSQSVSSGLLWVAVGSGLLAQKYLKSTGQTNSRSPRT